MTVAGEHRLAFLPRAPGWGSVSDKHHFHNILLEIEAADLKAAGASRLGYGRGSLGGL